MIHFLFSQDDRTSVILEQSSAARILLLVHSFKFVHLSSIHTPVTDVRVWMERGKCAGRTVRSRQAIRDSGVGNRSRKSGAKPLFPHPVPFFQAFILLSLSFPHIRLTYSSSLFHSCSTSGSRRCWTWLAIATKSVSHSCRAVCVRV